MEPLKSSMPLPKDLPERFRDSATMKSAYSIVLKFEEAVHGHVTKLIYARILGYLLLEGPSDIARMAVAREIVSCKDQDALEANGKFYCEHFIRPFRKYKGRTPGNSSHASRPSFDTLAEIMSKVLKEPVVNHADAKKKALVRDGFRCLVTERFDVASVDKIVAVKAIADAAGSHIATTETNCAHIIPESTNMNTSGEKDGKPNNKNAYASSVWAVLDRFGYKKILDDLNGNKVHRLENVLTFSEEIHGKFDTLRLWFEAVDGKENTYKLSAGQGQEIHIRSYPRTVTFTTPDPINLPLPSPQYLGLHAACCVVAHLSGAGEYINKMYWEFEDTKVLSKDGSSAEMLTHALTPLSHEVAVC